MPLRAGSCLDRELNAPSSEVPSRSRTSRARRLHTCSPAGEFNALTYASAQVKDESTPRRTWESRPDTVLPTPPVRPSPPLCDAVRHGQRQSRGTVPPLLYDRCATPSKEDGGALEGRTDDYATPAQDNAVMSGRQDRSPLSPSVLCGHPRRPQHHPGHCIIIPNTVEGWGDKTPPRRLLCAPRPPVCRTLEPMYKRRPNGRPLHHHPRSRSWTDTGHAMTPPRHKIRKDGRLLRGTVRHASTRRQNSATRL
jgi:hypothetical protein